MDKAPGNNLQRLQGLRGMPDILPEQTHLWQFIEEKARKHFKRACISEIRTPLLEATELFSRGIGEETDVVGKEMYSFVDRGERNCTLRPEGTASVVRASIQNGLNTQGPQKLWYLGPMFRYERPQSGRQRQFHQLGLEHIGFLDPRSDAEVIAIAWDFLCDIGLKDLIELEINSLGVKEDRDRYRTTLVNWLEKNRKNLDQDSQKRLNKNPLRILDSKDPQTREILRNAPLLINSLSSESIDRFNQVKLAITNLGIPFKENPLLVRGLDYYSHTAFEITSNNLGSQATVCGGGRYDDLIRQLGGTSTPAIGWAIGMERLVLLISQTGISKDASNPKFYVVNRGSLAEASALTITRDLRLKNVPVEMDFSRANFNKQLKRADKSGARWAIIIGENEAQGGKVILKDLRNEADKISKEETIDINSLLMRFD